MNMIINHPRLETWLSLLVVVLATASTAFGVCWSLYASVMLHA